MIKQISAKFWNYLNFREFSNSEKLRLVFVAIVLGIWTGQWTFLPEYLVLTGFLLLIIFFFYKSERKRNFIFLVLAMFLLTNSYAQWRNFIKFEKDILPKFIGQEVKIRGKIISFPDVREKDTRFYVEAESIKKASNFTLSESINKDAFKISTDKLGNFLLIVKNPAKFSINLDYGNEILVQGKLVLPQSFTTDFDYRDYLKRFGVQTIMKINPEKFRGGFSVSPIQILNKDQGNIFLQKAKKLRNLLEKNLEKSLPNPHAKIAMGVLLGVKNQLPKWTQNDFKNSGLMHLLVVSGTNVAIVMLAVGFLLRRFGKRIAFLGSLLALIFFVLMTGADAPILRAALMGGITGLAIAWGKMSDARNLVLLSAVIIGIFQPLVLQKDIGFALSFGATLGIIIGLPIFEKIFRENLTEFDNSVLKIFKIIALIFGVSISAQIAILPILMKSFGQFPIGGIPANLFTEPLMPFIMFFSFLTSLLGFLPLFYAKILAIPAYILIEILLQIAHFFSKIPPIIVSDFVNKIFAGLVLLLFIYGLFSKNFNEKFLVKDNV